MLFWINSTFTVHVQRHLVTTVHKPRRSKRQMRSDQSVNILHNNCTLICFSVRRSMMKEVMSSAPLRFHIPETLHQKSLHPPTPQERSERLLREPH